MHGSLQSFLNRLSSRSVRLPYLRVGRDLKANPRRARPQGKEVVVELAHMEHQAAQVAHFAVETILNTIVIAVAGRMYRDFNLALMTTEKPF
jgi:hypothetical protein